MPALILNLPAGAKAAPAAAISSSSAPPMFLKCSSGVTKVNHVSFASDRKFQVFRRRSSSNRSWIAATATAAKTKWLLEPTGDGDCSHIGEKVPLPSAFELSSDAATVGRVSDKADIVIPIGTEKKDSVLLVTDLDSTNGTYVDNRRVRPGAVTPVLPGSSITFGDEHLAQFQFSIVEEEDKE